jgi:hypothetical protein
MYLVQRCLAGVLCVTICAAAALIGARPAGAAEIGVSDQNAAAFAHPLFGWGGFRRVRAIAPWDAGLRPPPDLAWWLDATRLRGLDPLVTFGHRRGEDCRVMRCYLPTPDEMRAAVRAFRARWPHVTTFSTWNEANHPGQPTAGRPGTAARLYEAILAECAGCTVVAIEVLDIDGMESWLESFRRSLTSSAPRLWGLQNYGDVTRNRTTMTDRMVAAVPGEVWVTETGGIVRHVSADGQVRWPYDEERARASVARALALADRHAGRIGRVYFYQWRAAAGELWDSGLIRPDGTPRPSFDEITRRLGPPGPAPVVAPEPGPADAPAVPGGTVVAVRAADGEGHHGQPPPLAFLDAAGVELLRLVRRPSLSRTGIVRARVWCPLGRSGGCRARLAVRARSPAAPSGRRRPGRLLGRALLVVGAGRERVLAVRLRARDRRRVQRGRLRVLVVEVAVPGGPRWRVALRTGR